MKRNRNSLTPKISHETAKNIYNTATSRIMRGVHGTAKIGKMKNGTNVVVKRFSTSDPRLLAQHEQDMHKYAYDTVNSAYKKHITIPYITAHPPGKNEYYTVQSLATNPSSGAAAQTLSSYVKSMAYRPPQGGSVLLDKIRSFIRHLHNKGIEHGDLHGNNILVFWNTHNGKVELDFKVIDWGLAADVVGSGGHWKGFQNSTINSRLHQMLAVPIDHLHASARWLKNNDLYKNAGLPNKRFKTTLSTFDSVGMHDPNRPVRLRVSPLVTNHPLAVPGLVTFLRL